MLLGHGYVYPLGKLKLCGQCHNIRHYRKKCKCETPSYFKELHCYFSVNRVIQNISNSNSELSQYVSENKIKFTINNLKKIRRKI
jgi:hypothetical protein